MRCLMLRQPIVVVLGHVDHGKTTLLDKIRKTSVQKREAGGITQHIGATEVPIETIKEICGPLLEKLGIKFTIPGLLFIDTPGHEAFTNLRRRGGSIADLGVLVIDVSEGVMPQTREAIEILRDYKTPFLVAANKIDLIPGWKPREGKAISESLKEQRDEAIWELENRIYRIVGQLSEFGFESERFDRVKDFTRQVVIVPVSAKTGEGIPELLLFIAGLAQRYMEKRLSVSEGPGRGSVLEVKEEKGLGTTVDVILYDGKVRVGDVIALWGKDGPIVTKVRALLKPKPLDEMRDPEDRFRSVKEVHAASGVKICAPNLENSIAGSPFRVVQGPLEDVLREMQEEMETIVFETDKVGIVLKADTLGTLEAVLKVLRREGVPVKKADVGPVTKQDVVLASSIKGQSRFHGVIIAFNVKILKEAEEEAKALGIEIIKENIIYKVVEDYEDWVRREKEKERREKLAKLIQPAKIKILPGFVFRMSKPAIFGIEVLKGVIRPGYPLMTKQGKIVGRIRSIQSEGKSLQEANKGDKVAIAVEGLVIGRQVREGEELYTYIPKEQIEKLKELLDLLSEEERELLKEIKKLAVLSSRGELP